MFMKKILAKSLFRCLMGALLCSALPMMMSYTYAEEEAAEHAATQMMIKKVYKGINYDFFHREIVVDSQHEALMDMGVSFPEGASVKYSPSSRKLIMVNYPDEHKILKELVDEYKKSGAETYKTLQLIRQCKVVTGAPDMKAFLYAFICMDENALDQAEQSGYNLAKLGDYSSKEVKELRKLMNQLQKMKGLEVLLLLDEGCNLSKAKKVAKVLRLNGPVLVLDREKISEDLAAMFPGGDNMVVYDRKGEQKYRNSMFAFELSIGGCASIYKDWVEEARETEKFEKEMQEQEDYADDV